MSTKVYISIVLEFFFLGSIFFRRNHADIFSQHLFFSGFWSIDKIIWINFYGYLKKDGFNNRNILITIKENSFIGPLIYIREHAVPMHELLSWKISFYNLNGIVLGLIQLIYLIWGGSTIWSIVILSIIFSKPAIMMASLQSAHKTGEY